MNNISYNNLTKCLQTNKWEYYKTSFLFAECKIDKWLINNKYKITSNDITDFQGFFPG
jgi:hypothetical protein